jgi:hypothetical protein
MSSVRLKSTRGSSVAPNGSLALVRPSTPDVWTSRTATPRPIDSTTTWSPGRSGSSSQPGTRGSVIRIVTSLPHT